MEFKVEYIKDMNNNYLLLLPEENSNITKDTFLNKMLTENEIKGLLPCEIRTIDMEDRYYYDISSKQAIVNVFERGQVDELQTQKLVQNIIEAVKESKKYMLSESDFILHPEYVYMNISNFEIGLCYLPGYNVSMKEQLSVFLEFILEKLDHNNQKAIVMAYGLYKLIKGGEASFENIEEFMSKTIKEENHEQVYSFGTYKEEEKASLYVEESEEGKAGDREGVKEYEDEWNPQEEDKEEILYDSQLKFQFINLSNRKIIGISGVLYVILMAGIYISKIAHRDGQINIVLFISIAFTMLCAIVIVIMILNQKKTQKIEGELSGAKDIDEYDENNYWDREMLTGDEEDEDKTVLLTEYKKPSGFFLLDDKGKRVNIGSFPFVIGKFKDKVDYCIDDVTISRLHAKLDEYDENIVLVTDLNSTNGTFVGDRKLRANEVVKLELNEVLVVGAHKFQLIKDY